MDKDEEEYLRGFLRNREGCCSITLYNAGGVVSVICTCNRRYKKVDGKWTQT